MGKAGIPAGGFWGQLPGREQELLRSAGRARVFPPAATICVQGDPATHIFILLSGWVKVVAVTGEGQQTVLALRGDGDVVGEVAGEVTGYRTATVKTVGRVRSIVVTYRRFSAFLDANPAAARAYRHTLTRRWSDIAESLRVQSTSSGAQRLARLLVELAEEHGQGGEHQTTIELPLSQEELASLVSASRATVTRALHDWRQRRVVETSTRHITITDMAALARIAGRRTGPAPM
jgi:CRP/FNR family transcriptional regulator, cyclic AMP receptor protein